MSSRINSARRVVTGVDEDDKSCIWLDGDIPESAIFDVPEEGQIARVMWVTDELPAPIYTEDPMKDWFKSHVWFPDKGLHFGLVTWQPGAGFDLHASDTVDFGIIIDGALEMILEKESTELGPGDCFVQRGTMHGWKVVGNKPCTFAAVLMAKKQKEH